MKRKSKFFLALLALLVIAIASLAFNFAPVMRWSLRPSTPFGETTSPPAPNYDDPTHWSALPSTMDAADEVPRGLSAVDQQTARVDAFYVHPTSFLMPQWNASVPSGELDTTTDRVATRIQATVFNGCCAVYAPRYRQTNGLNFLEPSSDGERAFEVAYSDVERAFDEFNARRGPQRPFIIAAHSQGAMLAERLLARRVSRTPLREKLVAAYIIGSRTTVKGLQTNAPDIPICDSPNALRCVVAFNARSENYEMGPWDVLVVDPGERACVNPLTWRTDGTHAPASENLGAVFLDSDDSSTRPAFADAQCELGILRVKTIQPVPRDLKSSILDHVLGQGNYHPIEYQVFYRNLRANAILRSNMMLGGSTNEGG